jgi:phage-related protein
MLRLKCDYSAYQKITGSPLWEIKLKGKTGIRVIYVVHTKTAIIALHGFIKKSQKTPTKELNTALVRYKEWKNRH